MKLKNICEVQYKDPDTLQNRSQSTGSRWVGSVNDLVHGNGQVHKTAKASSGKSAGSKGRARRRRQSS